MLAPTRALGVRFVEPKFTPIIVMEADPVPGEFGIGASREMTGASYEKDCTNVPASDEMLTGTFVTIPDPELAAHLRLEILTHIVVSQAVEPTEALGVGSSFAKFKPAMVRTDCEEGAPL